MSPSPTTPGRAPQRPLRPRAAPFVLGPLSLALLAGLDRAFPAPAEPGALRAWLALVLEHPWRSTLALVLAWQALLGPNAQYSPPPVPAPARGVGRSAGSS